MCTYYYLHLHHVPPCNKNIEMDIQYTFCGEATIEMATGARQPCSNVYQTQAFDYTNPCASGGCLTSLECSSGACRLQQLNGRWRCCKCGRGSNKYTWCCHSLRKSPDTLCYHVCCSECQPHAKS